MHRGEQAHHDRREPEEHREEPSGSDELEDEEADTDHEPHPPDHGVLDASTHPRRRSPPPRTPTSRFDRGRGVSLNTRPVPDARADQNPRLDGPETDPASARLH